MASSVMHYFGFGAGTKPADGAPAASRQEEPVRALPASWYSDDSFYNLERRAIFSRRWLFMTHRSRLKGPGDWLRYTVAGYDLIIIRDRAGDISAFHNVCRHRAYPVVEKEGQGTAMILACRYHGWSYGLNGKLAKATGFTDMDQAEKEQNGLFKIHTKIDTNGFIWINMDSKEEPEVPWEEHFKGVDVQERYKQMNFDDYELDHTYELKGDFNWKALSDNFNECYHCPTTHADIPTFLNLDSFDSDLKDGHVQHHCEYTPEQLEKGLNALSTYYFPNSSMTISPHFMMIQKFLPAGARSSSMHYEIYRNRHSARADFELISATYARVMAEDKVLCDRAQRNINAGVYVTGRLHPRHEKAPIFIQALVRDAAAAHLARERAEGRELWPARQRLPGRGAAVARADVDVCRGAGAGAACAAAAARNEELLAW